MKTLKRWFIIFGIVRIFIAYYIFFIKPSNSIEIERIEWNPNSVFSWIAITWETESTEQFSLSTEKIDTIINTFNSRVETKNQEQKKIYFNDREYNIEYIISWDNTDDRLKITNQEKSWTIWLEYNEYNKNYCEGTTSDERVMCYELNNIIWLSPNKKYLVYSTKIFDGNTNYIVDIIDGKKIYDLWINISSYIRTDKWKFIYWSLYSAEMWDGWWLFISKDENLKEREILLQDTIADFYVENNLIYIISLWVWEAENEVYLYVYDLTNIKKLFYQQIPCNQAVKFCR